MAGVEEKSLVPLGEARLGRIGLDEWLPPLTGKSLILFHTIGPLADILFAGSDCRLQYHVGSLLLTNSLGIPPASAKVSACRTTGRRMLDDGASRGPNWLPRWHWDRECQTLRTSRGGW